MHSDRPDRQVPRYACKRHALTSEEIYNQFEPPVRNGFRGSIRVPTVKADRPLTELCGYFAYPQWNEATQFYRQWLAWNTGVVGQYPQGRAGKFLSTLSAEADELWVRNATRSRIASTFEKCAVVIDTPQH